MTIFKKKNILAIVIVTLTAIILAIFLYSNTAKARQADIVVDRTSNPIPADRSTPFYLYFAYGSINADSNILNAKASVNITGDGFEFVPAGFSDFYYGSPTRPDSENSPDVAVCNSAYTGPVYPISSSLATTTSFNYGYQTSTQTSTPGGSATAATLREKNTGCIRVQAKVKAGATLDQQATITFDPDAATSPSYQESNRPGKQVFILKIGQPTNSTPSPTTITSNNLSAGICTSIQLGSTTTCEFSLTGSTSNNYALPSSGITVTVPSSTASPACTLENNNNVSAKMVCANVPTTGASIGLKNVVTSLGNSPTATLTINAVPVAPTTIAVSNLNPGTCTSVEVAATTTCEFTLTGSNTNNYALPSSGITVTVPGSTVSPACTLENNNSNGAKMVCANVPTTGVNAGTKAVPTSLGSSPVANLILNANSTTSGSSTNSSSTNTSGNTTSSSATSGSGSSTSSSSSSNTSSSSTASSTSTTSSTSPSATATSTNTTNTSSTTSSGSTSSTGSSAQTTSTVSTGSSNITANTNDTKTITSPLTGISRFDITFDDQVTNSSIKYDLIQDNGSCTTSVPGTKKIANSFTYGFDKSKIKEIKVTFTLPAGVTNIKAYSCSSPGVETNVQSLGNNNYSATIPAASTFLVTAEPVANSTSTTRSGGFETLALVASITAILGLSYVLYNSKKKLGKIDISKE